MAAGRSPLDPWPDTVTWHPVSARLIIVEQVHLAGSAVVLLIAALAAWWGTGWNGWLVLALVVIAGTAVRATVIVRSVRSWGYAEREDDLLVRHGIWNRRLSIVPYARMQFVDVTAGPLERVLRLATVQLHTAARASNARVPGLASAEAARLRDQLTTRGEVRAEGL